MSSLKCPQCGLVNFATAISCRRCGMFFREIENAPISNQESAATSLGNEQNAVAVIQNTLQPNPQTPQNFPPPRPNNFQQPPYQNYQTPSKQKIGMALTSMILGLVGCFLSAPVGLILGIIALKKSNRNPREYGGKGFAIAGIVLNTLGLLFLPMVLAIAIPNVMASIRAANEASAVATIRKLAIAEEEFMATMFRCGDIKSLIATRLIDVDLASEEKNGYRFVISNLPQDGCEIYATPISSSSGNYSFFYSTQDGILRAAKNKGLPATKNDLPISDQKELFSKYAFQEIK